MSPRSRLWWKKTERIARIPPGSTVAVAAVTTTAITTEDSVTLTTENGQTLVTES